MKMANPTASEWHFGDPARVDGHHSHAYTVVHLDRLPPSLLSSSATEQVIMFSDALAMFVCGWFGPGCERGFRGSSVAATRLFAVGPAWITPRTRSLLPCCRIFVWESFDSRPLAVSHSPRNRDEYAFAQGVYGKSVRLSIEINPHTRQQDSKRSSVQSPAPLLPKDRKEPSCDVTFLGAIHVEAKSKCEWHDETSALQRVNYEASKPSSASARPALS